MMVLKVGMVVLNLHQARDYKPGGPSKHLERASRTRKEEKK